MQDLTAQFRPSLVPSAMGGAGNQVHSNVLASPGATGSTPGGATVAVPEVLPLPEIEGDAHDLEHSPQSAGRIRPGLPGGSPRWQMTP